MYYQRRLNNNHALGLGLILVMWTLCRMCYNFTSPPSVPHDLPITKQIRNHAERMPWMSACAATWRSFTKSFLFKRGHYPFSRNTLLVLMICGDIEPNPGPGINEEECCPCGYCGWKVSWSNSGIACEHCDIWYHRSCTSLSNTRYHYLAQNSTAWLCYYHFTHMSLIVTTHFPY